MTRARELSRLSNAITTDTNNNIGIGSTIPTSKLNVVGVVSATSYYGSGANLTGISSVSFATTAFNLSGTATTATAAGTAYGLSGSPNITVGTVTGSAATFTNLTVNGTQTIINTTSLEITDKNIGIGSTSSPTDALADGAGITIYGTTNKTLTWSNTTKNWTFVGGGVTVSDLSVSGNLGIGTTNPTAKLQVQGTVSCSSTISDAVGDVRSIPQNARTSSYTLVATDRGKHIGITTGGVTIPTNIFAVGDAISIYNNSDYNQTITQGASTTLRLAGSALTGNRTFGQYGLCTVLCVSSNTFVINGAGLS